MGVNSPYKDEISQNKKSPDQGVRSVQTLHQAVEEFEKTFIRTVLSRNQGKKAATAEKLGIDRKTLYNKLKKYGIE